MAYQPGIPTGTIPLDQDYLNLQGNFGQINTTYGTDHIPLTQVQNNGFHGDIHLVPVSTVTSNPPNNYPASVPGASAGVGQLFTAGINDGINSDEALYYQTGGGRVIQITSNFVPKNSQNGFSMLPGGLIIQWGVVNFPPFSGVNTVTFATANRNFTTLAYNVQTTMIGNSSGANNIGIVSASATNFTWRFTGSSSSSFTGFYWLAIGK